MIYRELNDLITTRRRDLAKGPLALVFLEDEVEITSSLRHLLSLGFRHIVTLAHPAISIPQEFTDLAYHVHIDTSAAGYVASHVNRIIKEVPGTWVYFGFNAEYYYYPFCETRSITELTGFVAEERRDTVLSYTIDAYAEDLRSHPNAVSREEAMIDKTGYYALDRVDPETGNARPRQKEFFGGLHWRYEEHIPKARRHIDRISLFKAKPGLKLGDDFRFNDEEYNTYQCPWHHNLTAAVISFRTAKALRRNPGSRAHTDSFLWPSSTKLDWHSQQLLDLGLIEPGQWF